MTGINRTFMELKLNGQDKGTRAHEVLIEPLWNWNVRAMLESVWIRCINRTFMELKHGVPVFKPGTQLVLIEPLWNWNEDIEQILA